MKTRKALLPWRVRRLDRVVHNPMNIRSIFGYVELSKRWLTLVVPRRPRCLKTPRKLQCNDCTQSLLNSIPYFPLISVAEREDLLSHIIRGSYDTRSGSARFFQLLIASTIFDGWTEQESASRRADRCTTDLGAVSKEETMNAALLALGCTD